MAGHEAGRGRFAADDRIVRHDGTIRWVAASAAQLAFGDGALASSLVLLLDVTEPKRVEIRLRGTDELLRRSFEDAPIGMVLAIGEGVIERANESLMSLVGHDATAIGTVGLYGLCHANRRRLVREIERQLRLVDRYGPLLIFEVTETAAVGNIQHARGFAERLSRLGCRLSLDDFGAGLGSFSYLKHLPFDFLKIDGEFVKVLAENPIDRLVIDAVVGIARGLGKRTIAEFVEDARTLALPRESGVDLVQGFWIGRPAPALEVRGRVEYRNEGTPVARG